jgi:hypothetical protein
MIHCYFVPCMRHLQFGDYLPPIVEISFRKKKSDVISISRNWVYFMVLQISQNEFQGAVYFRWMCRMSPRPAARMNPNSTIYPVLRRFSASVGAIILWRQGFSLSKCIVLSIPMELLHHYQHYRFYTLSPPTSSHLRDHE